MAKRKRGGGKERTEGRLELDQVLDNAEHVVHALRLLVHRFVQPPQVVDEQRQEILGQQRVDQHHRLVLRLVEHLRVEEVVEEVDQIDGNVGVLVLEQLQQRAVRVALDQLGVELGGRGERVQLLDLVVQVHLRLGEGGGLRGVLHAHLVVPRELLLQPQHHPLRRRRVQRLHLLRLVQHLVDLLRRRPPPRAAPAPAALLGPRRRAARRPRLRRVVLALALAVRAHLAALRDDDLAAGLAALRAEPFHAVDDLVVARGHLAEHDVLAVEPVGLDGAEEELRAVRVGAGVGHG